MKLPLQKRVLFILTGNEVVLLLLELPFPAFSFGKKDLVLDHFVLGPAKTVTFL